MIMQFGIAEECYKHHENGAYGFDNLFESTSIKLVSARRDWAAFQVLVKSDEDFVLAIDGNPNFSAYGPLKQVRLAVIADSISQNDIKMNLIGMIDDDDGVRKADLLLNNKTIMVKKDEVQSVWVEIAVPENMSPDLYTGCVNLYTHTMFGDESSAGSLSFELTVKNATLPEAKDYSFHLDLWQHLSNISRKHEVALWSDEHFTVIEKYVKSLGELGQKAVTVIASEIPWSGQMCFENNDNYVSDLFEYSMVHIKRNKQGVYEYDFSVVERYVELCFKYGISKEIEVFGLTNIWASEEKGYGGPAKDYIDAIRLCYIDEVDGCYKFIRTGAEIEQYIKAVENFFIEKGWIGKVLIVADEPEDEDLYKRRIGNIKRLAPSFKFKTAINHAEFIGRFKDDISSFVPALPCVCNQWDTITEMRKSVEGSFHWYVCCWPMWPNTFIASPLLESRLIGILTAFIGFDGFLRWNYTVWPENPRERLSYRHPEWKAGDTNFVYPANDGSPLLSLRYKNLKRGIEDFELINMLKRENPKSEEILIEVWEIIFKNEDINSFYSNDSIEGSMIYSLSYSDYQRVKTLLLSNLE